MHFHSLFEPEEVVGHWWHRLVGERESVPRFPDAAMSFAEVENALRVFFHALGGGHGVEIKPAMATASGHRLSLWSRLGRAGERVARARYDGDRFLLPDRIDAFPERELNRRLYFWLAAWATVAGEAPPAPLDDPLRDDLLRLAHALRATRIVLARYPGLGKHWDRLARAARTLRPERRLPPTEEAMEQAIRALLGDAKAASPWLEAITALAESGAGGAGASAALGAIRAPKGYRPHFPVPLWGEVSPLPARERSASGGEGEERGGGGRGAEDERVRRARRRESDQAERKGGLVIYRFDKILSWAEFLNLHRESDDSEEEQAKKAADDLDEISLTRSAKRPATRLKFDLDLSPRDVETERLSASHAYPEWDYRAGAYLPDHVRVLARRAETDVDGARWRPDRAAARRIRAVRRQFEALRPKREIRRGQIDGTELDMDALIRARADLLATGAGSDRIYCEAREQARDLAVAVLIDVSRSTEAYVENRAVIDIEREALTALAEGLAASGDDCAIYAFSSLRRDRVWIADVKDFDEPVGPLVRARIAALRPGFYTRLGAAVRHVSAALHGRENRRKLLLVLTDGKPNDLDHYDGRYGIEDSRKAILEARALGQAVFGITIDSRAQSYFPRIFGAGAFAIVGHPARLTSALPVLYRHLVA